MKRELSVYLFPNLPHRIYKKKPFSIRLNGTRTEWYLGINDPRYALPCFTMYPEVERRQQAQARELQRRSARVQEEAAIRVDYYRRLLTDELGERCNDLSPMPVSGGV